MPQSLSRIWLHIVFSTKERQAFLQDDTLRDEMFCMLGYHANETSCPTVRVGGWYDHIHILCGLARTITVAKLVEVLKKETSKWVKSRDPKLRSFYWQNGYGAFSASQSLLESVIEYIENQPVHHARMSFQDEFRAICSRHGVQVDERYAWD
jgi:REP element-mobilizing transposase RayT